MWKVTFIEAQQRMLGRYGVTVESRFVDVPSVEGRAQVLVSGEGPGLVLLNGIGTPAAMWAPLMAQLRGFTLYAVDLPGYGLTDTVEHFTDGYRSRAVTFVDQVLDALDLGRAAFVANSLGSLWTMWTAIERPERVAAMVHVGCPALILGTSAPLPMRLMSVPALAAVIGRLQPPSPRQVQQMAKMVHQYPLVPELSELLVATERLPGFDRAFRDTLHGLVRLRGARPDMVLGADQLRQVTQPVQLIWGADDPMGKPSIGEHAAELMPDARLHVVAGGHAPWLTEAETIGRLATAFLGQHQWSPWR